MGKGTEDPHRRLNHDVKEQAGPEIEMDMAHMKTDGSYYAKGEEVNFSNVWCSQLSTGDDSQPKEDGTKMVTEWLKKKSYRKVTIRTDGENL